MKKRIILSVIASTVMLTGCSSDELSGLKADVNTLQQEMAEVKAQLGALTGKVNVPAGNEEGAESSSSATKEQNFVLGQPITIDGKTYVITEGERKKQVTENGRITEDGYEFITYNIEVQNGSNQDHHYLQEAFNLVLSSGEVIHNFTVIGEEGHFSSGTLASGGKRSGWIAFEIPQGDQPRELRYKIGREMFEFKVKLNE